MTSASATLSRLSRIPKRVLTDARIFLLLKNWREALRAELTGAPLTKVHFRNGSVLSGPAAMDLAFIFHEIWVQRTYSKGQYRIKRGDVIVDVGANVGAFAIYAATAAPDVTVHAFEPFPGNLTWLRKNVEESGLTNVIIHEQAIASVTEKRALHVNPEKWISHSLVRDEGRGDEDVTVNCVTLSEALESNNIKRCNLLKLDCEGSEYEILMRSEAKTLDRVERIVGEYHEAPEIPYKGDTLREFLEDHSFHIDYFSSLEVDCGIFYATNTVHPS